MLFHPLHRLFIKRLIILITGGLDKGLSLQNVKVDRPGMNPLFSGHIRDGLADRDGLNIHVFRKALDLFSHLLLCSSTVLYHYGDISSTFVIVVIDSNIACF